MSGANQPPSNQSIASAAYLVRTGDSGLSVDGLDRGKAEESSKDDEKGINGLHNDGRKSTLR